MNSANFVARSTTRETWNSLSQVAAKSPSLFRCAMHSGACQGARHDRREACKIFIVCRGVRKYRRQMVRSIETNGTTVPLAEADWLVRLSVRPPGGEVNEHQRD